MPRSLAVIFALFASLSQIPAAGAGLDYWVWHRSTPLTGNERTELAAQDVRTLYWHVGEMENRSGAWRWKSPPRPLAGTADGFHTVPVVRLTSESRQPLSADAIDALGVELKAVADDTGSVQLDFDCPDRLLADYAAALHVLRRAVPHLSITALAHWPRLGAFPELARAVEEIAPMFYDLQADPTGVGPENPPPALLEPAQFESVLSPGAPVPFRGALVCRPSHD